MPAEPVVVTDDDEAQAAAFASLTARQRAFLAALMEEGTIQAAATKIGIHRNTVAWWAKESAQNAAFAIALDEAQEAVADKIEKALFDQAMTGNTAWDTTARIFLLKGKRPMYRDNYTVRMESLSVNASLNLNELEPAERASLLRIALAAEQRQIAAPVVDQDDEDDEEGG